MLQKLHPFFGQPQICEKLLEVDSLIIRRLSLGNHYSYEIRVEGHLGNGWKEWFEFLEIHRAIDIQTGVPVTRLQGSFPDQAALFGVLQKICDLNLKLIDVRRLDALPD